MTKRVGFGNLSKLSDMSGPRGKSFAKDLKRIRKKFLTNAERCGKIAKPKCGTESQVNECETNLKRFEKSA